MRQSYGYKGIAVLVLFNEIINKNLAYVKLNLFAKINLTLFNAVKFAFISFLS